MLMDVQSIGSDERCIENWKKAIKALPEDGPTEAETKQKTQYEAELKAAEEKLRKLKTAPVQGLHSRAERAPWIRAQNMEEELRARGDDLLHSSVCFISNRFSHIEPDFVQAVVIAAAYAVSYSSCTIALGTHRVYFVAGMEARNGYNESCKINAVRGTNGYEWC